MFFSSTKLIGIRTRELRGAFPDSKPLDYEEHSGAKLGGPAVVLARFTKSKPLAHEGEYIPKPNKMFLARLVW